MTSSGERETAKGSGREGVDELSLQHGRDSWQFIFAQQLG